MLTTKQARAAMRAAGFNPIYTNCTKGKQSTGLRRVKAYWEEGNVAQRQALVGASNVKVSAHPWRNLQALSGVTVKCVLG